jgi:hemolysin III
MTGGSGGGEPTSAVREVGHAAVSRAIYGLMTVLAVLQVMELHPPSAWQAAVSLFGTTLAVALVDAYADSIAEMLSRGRTLLWDELRAIGRDVAPILVGAQGPTLVMILSALGLLTVDDAIDLAQAVAFLFLFGYGWRVGKLLHEHWARRLVSGLILVAIGGFIVGIKAAFH